MKVIKQFLKLIAPYGLVEHRRSRLAKHTPVEPGDSRKEYHALRHQKISAVEACVNSESVNGIDRKQVIAFLKSRGLDEQHLVEGSVPQRSLEYICEKAIRPLDSAFPLTALHVGNFVGVSLVFLATALRQKNQDSLVVSVDPNLTHRGISNPQAHVSALLAACGVQRNTMIIAGYSGIKSISNDGTVFGDYDPKLEFSKEFACEETLRNLAFLSGPSFDLVLIDGNHDSDYLVKEIKSTLPLLKTGGYLVLDDVDVAWGEIREVFSQITDFGFESIGTDGRVGIARLEVQPSRRKAEPSACSRVPG